MHKIKEMLMEELKEFEKKSDLKAGDLETIHKLTDTVKNIDKIEMLEDGEGGYSEAGGWMADGRMYGTYDHGSSYARGRRNARRDSRGRYSREGGMGGSSYARGGNQGGGNYSREGGYSRDEAKDYMMDRIEEMMEEAETPKQREALQNCIKALERA